MLRDVLDFSTYPTSLNSGVEEACGREACVATKAYELCMGTDSSDEKYNLYIRLHTFKF